MHPALEPSGPSLVLLVPRAPNLLPKPPVEVYQNLKGFSAQNITRAFVHITGHIGAKFQDVQDSSSIFVLPAGRNHRERNSTYILRDFIVTVIS